MTIARDLNNTGDVVGEYQDDAGAHHGFFMRNGVYARIDYPNASTTRAFGINNRRDIVGSYSDDAGTHGFWMRAGSYTTMDFPEAVSTVVTDLNEDGVIVGYFVDMSGDTHGFIYKKQTIATGR